MCCFFFVSFVDLHTCRFIHSLQTIMQEVFILYLCDDLPLLFLWLFFFSFSIMSKNTFLLRFLARLIRNSYLQSFANLLAFVYFDSFSECLACYVCILHRKSQLTDMLNVFTRTIQLQCYSVLFQMFFNI